IKRSVIAAGLALLGIALLLLLRNGITTSPIDTLRLTTESGVSSYSGSWHFPRGGPYVLGFESEKPAKLYIENKLVARGQGIVQKRIVYQPGNYAMRLETSGRVRLLWHPPGRRGPLEYVPASSLSPDILSSDRFSPNSKISDEETSGSQSSSGRTPTFSRPGRSLGDGLFALAIIGILMALVLFFARKKLAQINRQHALVGAGLFALALLVRLYGLGDAGQTWDEDVNWSAGRNYITNLLNLDFSESSWKWNYEHPPVMKYLAGIGAQFTDGYTGSRAVSAVLGALACALLVPIGQRLYGLRVGVLAAVFAAFSPHLIAHSKVVGHESPTVFFWALAIWLSLRAHDKSADVWKLHKRMAVIGIVLGLAIFSRYINGLLAPLVGVILLLGAPPEDRKKTVLLGITILLGAAVVTCFVVWPRMWSTPIDHMQESWAKLKKPHGVEPYLGVLTESPGRSYFFMYLWATAPLGLLIAAKVFVVRAIHRRKKAALYVFAWLLVPLIVTFSPVRQDGVRYIMPSILAMNIMAAAGVDYLLGLAASRVSVLSHRLALPIAGALLTLYLTIVCIRIHPFYLDYYGEQVGGPKAVAAAKRFEIAWWGEGMNQALDYLNENAEPDARVYKACFQPGHLAWMRGDLWPKEARRPQDADWFLVYQPSVRGCPIPKDTELVFEASAQGAPLARVYRRILSQEESSTTP
ncbi:MAG: glycosyltransferase family 39 protein, partial [Kofleriaceae bacterium]|nr:glycosyltransferase family 39 protein [Kofleriaceae bacterium]